MALTYIATSSGYLGRTYYTAGQSVDVTAWSVSSRKRAMEEGKLAAANSSNGGMTFAGEWAAGTYPSGTIVTKSGSLYMNISTSATTATPGTVNVDWKQLAT